MLRYSTVSGVAIVATAYWCNRTQSKHSGWLHWNCLKMLRWKRFGSSSLLLHCWIFNLNQPELHWWRLMSQKQVCLWIRYYDFRLDSLELYLVWKYCSFTFHLRRWVYVIRRAILYNLTVQKSHHPPGNHHAPKNVLFPGHNHLLTTGTDDPTFWLSPKCQRGW